MSSRISNLQTKAIENEKALFSALEQGENQALEAFEHIGGRSGLDFSCRCYSAAIERGMVALSLAFARAGLNLSVSEEPIRDAHPKSEDSRGLKSFMEQYRYCKAKRTYYLPIVLSEKSTEPIAALLSEKLLKEADASELLTLALRHGNIALARVLADGGATLPDSIRGSVPENLKGKSEIFSTDTGNRWRTFVSPQYTLEVIELALEHAGNEPCNVVASWLTSYRRQSSFASKLAAIVVHSDGTHCEAAPEVLTILAASGKSAAVAHMASWNTIGSEDLACACKAAQDAGYIETASILIGKRSTQNRRLASLSLEEKDTL